MAKVVLENISKSFGEKEILKNINLEIQDGEFVVLVGASGCGKSTLLRMVAGLENPSEGTIAIDDEIVNDVHPKDRNIAMVFQSYALYPHLNVYDNISLGLKVRKMAKCEIDRRIKRVAEILKLDEYLKRKPKELSGGQRQRVALARAIVREPKVFLMDEPLSNLDAKLRSEMRAEIKKLHQKLKTTFIYVTHDQTEALTMGDRIVVLNNGEVQQIDTPHNVYNHPKNTFVATFMGSSPMNIVEARVKDNFLVFGNLTISLDSLPFELQLYKRVLVGVRSEDIANSTNPTYHFNIIKFSTKVQFEENLGSHKNIYFKLGDADFCATVSSQTPKVEEMDFSINPRDLHFFDYETKEPIVKKMEFGI
ncbi:MAG: sn-glycerol-3-phosphate ABC transporter ATP-binding protein UgpC [Candidatus Gastranaerophilales bacterium]|nr:sn-glycerol-3-phosphate ABC transporter ATP-binding protein UgpC [Candidatus Gastranaerophilales bacterium]